MQIPVVIERLPGNRFRAKSAAAQLFAVEADSVEESLRLWRERFAAVLPANAEVVRVEPTVASEHPLARFAGDLKDDPLFDDWCEAIEEFRRQRDLEDGLP
jgi:hypothetical protein